MKIIAAIICTCAMLTAAHAQQTKSFTDKDGRFAGSSIQRGRQTDFFDARGRFSGSTFSQGTPSNPQGRRER